MRTTLNLPDSLLKEAKIYAAENSVTLTRLVMDGLIKVLKSHKTKEKKNFVLPVSKKKGGTYSGWDFDDMKSVYAKLDQDIKS